MRKKAHFCVVPLLLCLCFSSKSNENKIQVLEFAVVDSLLQKPVIAENLNISFRPPARWSPAINDSLVQKIKESASRNGAPGTCDYLFADTLSRAFFILSRNSSFNPKNGDSLLLKIEESYHAQFPKSETRRTAFKKDSFRVHQIMVNLGTTVVLRMFFNAEKCPPFEAAFIFPGGSFVEQMKKIESVIGSIRLLHP
jgi:hypothetical protein